MAEKTINIDQTVQYLNRQFAKVTSEASSKIGSHATRERDESGKVHKTPLYKYQVEFSYLINEIQRGPRYIVPKRISEANQLINKIENEKRA